MDDLDRAAHYEQVERDAAIARHARRTQPRALCESCEEQPVHVTAAGTHWRFCPDCAEDHLRRSQAG